MTMRFGDCRVDVPGRRRVGAVFALACFLLVLLLIGGAGVDAQVQVAPEAQGTQDTATSPTPTPEPAALAPQISLLTVGPGPIFFERFGHNAIVVRDPLSGTALAYNYGLFDFEQEDFLLNFARGRMRYLVAPNALEDDLAMYRNEGRSIVEQRLNLSSPQARTLAEFLAWNAQPEHAYYRYDYFLANCSTRVRDAIDQAIGGALRAQTEGRSRGYTYRIDALRLMAPQPLLMLGIDLGLGPMADQRIDFWQESFVPMTLSDAVAQVELTGIDGRPQPLVASTSVIAHGHVQEPPMLPPDLRVPFLILGLALGAIVLWSAQRVGTAPRIALSVFATVFELFCGLGGLLLLFLWFGTEHHAAWRNENLMLLNPLCLLLIPAALSLGRAHRWRRPFAIAVAWLIVVVAAFALFSKILPWFVQSNLAWIVLLLPIHLALAITLTRAQAPAPAHQA